MYTFISVSGLALGVACCVIIFLMIRFETSFDEFHTNAGRIYRINLNYKTHMGREQSGYNFTPLTDAVRLSKLNNNTASVDSSHLKMLSHTPSITVNS
jgi:putative ABC transport system permease protein